MAFGIDDAIVEVAAEAAKEGASEVTSSSSGILEMYLKTHCLVNFLLMFFQKMYMIQI